MWRHLSNGSSHATAALTALSALILVAGSPVHGYNTFDVVSGVIESSRFKGKPPLVKLHIAAGLLRSKKLKQGDMALFFLQWADDYLREPPDPLERLKRWAALANDEQLSTIRIPRDFLNRMLLAEYLVTRTDYLKSSPHDKLALLATLERDKLVDWSVALAYARLYAGVMISGAKTGRNSSPHEALEILKALKDKGLVGWHYRVPTEAILAAELLALDKDYRSAPPVKRLKQIGELQAQGLISALTRKELERLPAWRLVVHDPAFLKADTSVKRNLILGLKEDQLISETTAADLVEVFCPVPVPSPTDQTPTAVPRTVTPPTK